MNGLLYEGDFREGLRHGFGYNHTLFRVLSLNGKTIYEGEWQRDRICGKGLIRNIYLINKRRLDERSAVRYCLYEGYFQDNRFHGNGTLLLSNGDRFVGIFSQGQLKDQYSVLKYICLLCRKTVSENEISVA